MTREDVKIIAMPVVAVLADSKVRVTRKHGWPELVQKKRGEFHAYVDVLTPSGWVPE